MRKSTYPPGVNLLVMFGPHVLDLTSSLSKALGLSFGSLFMSCLPRRNVMSYCSAKKKHRRSVAGLVDFFVQPIWKKYARQVGDLFQQLGGNMNKYLKSPPSFFGVGEVVVATSR